MAPAPLVYHDTYSAHQGVEHDAMNMLDERRLGKIEALEDEVRRHAA